MESIIVDMLTVIRMTDLALLRLLQLSSPALPVGAFAYSQGLEHAVELGYVRDHDSTYAWLSALLEDNLGNLDLPVLSRLYLACRDNDVSACSYWSRFLLASRETAELRHEENQRGRALATLVNSLENIETRDWLTVLQKTQLAGMAFVAVRWGIAQKPLLLGSAWSWLENQVAAAVKLVPLGQTAGQRLQLQLAEMLPDVVEKAILLDDADLGASAPVLAIVSSLHETQYSRLFRS